MLSGHRRRGVYSPPFSFLGKTVMKELSIFIEKSGNFCDIVNRTGEWFLTLQKQLVLKSNKKTPPIVRWRFQTYIFQIFCLFININCIIKFFFHNNTSKKNDPTWYALLRGVSGSVVLIIYDSKQYVKNRTGDGSSFCKSKLNQHQA